LSRNADNEPEKMKNVIVFSGSRSATWDRYSSAGIMVRKIPMKMTATSRIGAQLNWLSSNRILRLLVRYEPAAAIRKTISRHGM